MVGNKSTLSWRKLEVDKVIFFKFYCVFCVLAFIFMELCIYESIQKVKRKYADQIKMNKDKARANPLETLCVHIKIFITCFVPLINLGIFWSVLFNGIQVQENAMKKVNDAIKESEKK